MALLPNCDLIVSIVAGFIILDFNIIRTTLEIRVDWDVNNMLASISRLITSKMMTSSAIGAGKELYQFSPHRKVHQIESADDYQPFSFLSSV